MQVIYQPKGQAGEYAEWASNHYRGCGHACVYCYVPAVTFIDRRTFDAGGVPRANYLKQLERDCQVFVEQDLYPQIMFSFSTDPYSPTDVEHKLTRKALSLLNEYGLGFCTLTKGGRRAMRDLDLFKPAKDAFASTLTTLDKKQSTTWEPQAALPHERIQTLRAFHEAGIFTWVSLEPVYDTDATIAVIEETAEFVDLYKIGRINYHRLTAQTDWAEFTQRVLAVVNRLRKPHYIKKDLQPFLPKGYNNPLRIKQARAMSDGDAQRGRKQKKLF